MELLKSFFFAFVLVLIITPELAEAGLLSTLSKLGKAANKVDGPDAGLPSSFHFKDALANLPEGTVAEISLVNGRWMAKTPDGKQRFVDEFVDQVDSSNNSPTLILSEANLPKSLNKFNDLPTGLNIQIVTRNGKKYKLQRTTTLPILRYENIEITITETTSLDKVIWQLQRPAMTQKVRFVQLSKDADAALPDHVFSSKPVVEAVGINQLIKTIENMRLETLVLSTKVVDGFVHYRGQRLSVKALEQAAATRDVNLIILGTDKPKKAIQRVANDWGDLDKKGEHLFDSVGDFYNRFTPEGGNTPMRIKMNDSGELQTALHIDKKPPTANNKDSSALEHLAVIPLHLLIESVKIVQPSEERVKELDRRIHPAVPSSIQFYLIFSFFIGAFTAVTSWRLYKNIWGSPTRSNSRNIFSFSAKYLLHRLCFVALYLPILGLFSPIYLIVKWTIAILNFLLIRPSRWLYAKVV